MSYTLFKPLLYSLDAETAHDLVGGTLGLVERSRLLRAALRSRFTISEPRLARDLLGCRFAGPLGLAAGFDKDGRHTAAMAALGFDFLEVGTVTPRAQPGNAKPRLFRHPEHGSLQNALGFNNGGMAELAKRLASRADRGVPVGVNVGKNKATPIDRAEEDYAALFDTFATLCDFFVVNLSSPNTPGLRSLQEVDVIARLLSLAAERTDRPVLVKLAPDMEPKTAIELSVGAVEAGARGVVLTNTTTDYALIPEAEPFGGLSGRVLKERSFELLCAVAGELYGDAVLVSVGGIDSGDEVYRRLKAGASLTELYTALVYEGPGLPARIHRRLLELMDRDGVETIDEIVGAEAGGDRRT